MIKLLFTLTATLFFISNAHAQVNTIEYLDINNVRAGILTHGDMFWNIDSQKASYEFPKGSGLHSGYVASLWVSGIDTGSNLHVSAQTYRQNGSDYWPGPLSVGLLDSTTSNKWDKIWKVNQTTIDSFQAINPHTVFNTPAAILEWPAKGNMFAAGKNSAALIITTDMAPFVDVNNDGIYKALDGDYPKIKGEQALWWVFNDQKIHTESGGLPFNLQFKAMGYACNSIPALQNVTFYSYDITNASPLAYTQTRIGIFTDIDLGYSFDDYIGIDTARRMSFTYNGDNYDDGPKGYGSMLTKSATLFIHSPQDSFGYKSPVGAYTYYNNSMGFTGNPSQYMDYDNYLRGKWKDGQQFTTACDARSITGSTSFTNYVMYGDPCVNNSWSEKQCNNTPADRRFIITTSDFTFTPGAELNMTFALINTPRALDTCSISLLQAIADTVMMYPNGCGSNQALAVQNILLEKSVDIYPNPTQSNLTIQWNDELKGQIESLTIVNAIGSTNILNYLVKQQ